MFGVHVSDVVSDVSIPQAGFCRFTPTKTNLKLGLKCGFNPSGGIL